MSNNYTLRLEKWKSLVLEPSTLIIGIDISKDKHDVCFGTRDTIFIRRFSFKNSQVGFELFIAKIKELVIEKNISDILFGLEPTGVYWRPLNNYLGSKNYTVCLVDPLSVFHNRKTNHQDKGKSDLKDAICIHNLIGQRKFFFPTECREKDFYLRILLRSWMSAQKDLIREKSRMSSYLSLTFPEFEKLVSKINSSKSINFLNTFPTPESILKYSKDDFIEKCRAELKRFSVEILKDIYLAAEKSIGVNLFKENLILPNYIESFSNANNLEKKRFEQCNAMAIREEGYSKIKAIKGMGPKIVTGILLSMGNYKAFSKASQITKLTGLNLVDKTSGSSVHSPAHISHQGNRDLRYWAYCGALQVIKYPGPFQKMYKRKTKGKKKNGSGKKSLIAVSDKLVRTIWAILKKGGEYNPDYESDTRK